MFRRDKDPNPKLDSEGRRRMREAIDQRTHHEEDPYVDRDDQEESSYRSSLLSSSLSDSYGSIQPFDTGDGDAPEASGFSWSRPERGVVPVEPPPPARSEEEPWVAPAPAAPAQTTVAADTMWRGTLRSSAPIRIEGTFEGEIDTDEALHIAANAKVDATVQARMIVVAGQLNGRVECRERLEILATGRVTGQIDAGRFVVHEGAFLGGQVRMKGATQGAAAGGDEDGRPLLQRVR